MRHVIFIYGSTLWFFFFWFAVVFLLLLFDTGMVLKRDWTGQSDRFNWEPAFNLVQLWAKTKNDLKTKEIRKPGSSTGESGTGMVESVNDRLGFFFIFPSIKLRHFEQNLKTNPKVLNTLSLTPHLKRSTSLSQSHLKLTP